MFAPECIELEGLLSASWPPHNSHPDTGKSDYLRADEENFSASVCIEAIEYLLSFMPETSSTCSPNLGHLVREENDRVASYLRSCDLMSTHHWTARTREDGSNERTWCSREDMNLSRQGSWEEEHGPQELQYLMSAMLYDAVEKLHEAPDREVNKVQTAKTEEKAFHWSSPATHDA